MYVSKKLKLIFVRTPKTGSTSVYNGYRHYHGEWDQHWGVHPLPKIGYQAKAYKELFPDYTWIAGVRHPETWLPSYYNWAKGATSFWATHMQDAKKPADHISRFMRQIRYTPMDWTEHPDIHIEVYPLEKPDRIEELLGFKLAHHNPASKPKAELNLTDEDWEYFNELFKRELEYYDD